MAWHTSFSVRSTDGRLVEYKQEYGGGTGQAEGRARVYVAGKMTVDGWSSDGKTYEAFVAAIGTDPKESCILPDFCQLIVTCTCPKGDEDAEDWGPNG
jgi:hypothetical protein